LYIFEEQPNNFECEQQPVIGNLAPQSDATRAEAVTMLQRFVEAFEIPPYGWIWEGEGVG